MAHFPSFGPFYDPEKEHEVYLQQDRSLRVRNRPPTPSGRRLETGTEIERIPKIDLKWSDHVHPEQGDLFYIDVDGNTRARSNSLPHSAGQPQLATPSNRKDSLSRQNGSRHSDSAVVPSRLLRGSGSEEDEEDKLQSRAELRKKSEQLQQVLRKKQDRPRNGEVRSVGRHRKAETNRSLSNPALIQQNNSKLLLSQSASESIMTNNQSFSQDHNGAIPQQTNGRHLKDVFLVPDYSRRSDSSSSRASGAELFELLLGIVLCRYKQRPTAAGGAVNGEAGEGLREKKERKVVVQGVVTGSVADKSGNVHRGDTLLYLNGQEVTWSNLNSVMQNVKREIKLTFQVPKIIGPTSCSAVSSGSSRLPAYHNLCLLVTGRDIFSLQQQLLQHKCIAMYLTLSTSAEEKTPHDDIVYSFPPQEEALTAIRGLFLTLNSSLRDIMQSGADSSSLVIGGELVNVVYHQQGRDVFVMAAPALRVQLHFLRSIVNEVCRMLSIVFGAVDRAFHSGETGQLDQVFALFFHRLLHQPEGDNYSAADADQSGAPPCWQPAVEGMFAAPVLQLSEENRLICDEILSEFEAVDFDDCLEKNELYARRSFSLLGSSLFYKNDLVCNHLQESDLRDVYGFLRCHSLLTLACKQPIDELVIWQEMYLTRRQSSVTMETSTVGYQEPSARWFMLVVGMKHFLLACVLEAGGCSHEALGRPGPHPLFVGQARATLVQLDADDVHMSACCHDRLMEDIESPVTTSTERFVTHSRQTRDDTGAMVKSVASKPPSPGRAGSDNPFKYRSSPRTDHRMGADSDAGSETVVMTRQGSKLSYGSNDSGGSGSSNGAPKSKASRFSSLLDVSSIGRSMSALHIDTIGTPTAQGKLSRGKDNVLFHFIHYNDDEGMLVTSPDPDLTWSPSNKQNEVMVNFHRCVLNIHALFCERDAQEKQEKGQSAFERDLAMTQGIEEYGVLFQCCPTPSSPAERRASMLNYWVVGRRFSSQSNKHELYVCFHESSSQSLVEMAFALGFGS